MSQACIPLFLSTRTIATQDLLNRAMETLSQTISLRMIGSRESNSTAKQRKQLLPKLAGKTDITVTNYLFWYSILADPFLKKDISNIQCTTSGSDWNKTAKSRKSVNDAKNSIIATCTHR